MAPTHVPTAGSSKSVSLALVENSAIESTFDRTIKYIDRLPRKNAARSELLALDAATFKGATAPEIIIAFPVCPCTPWFTCEYHLEEYLSTYLASGYARATIIINECHVPDEIVLAHREMIDMTYFHARLGSKTIVDTSTFLALGLNMELNLAVAEEAEIKHVVTVARKTVEAARSLKNVRFVLEIELMGNESKKATQRRKDSLWQQVMAMAHHVKRTKNPGLVVEIVEHQPQTWHLR